MVLDGEPTERRDAHPDAAAGEVVLAYRKVPLLADYFRAASLLDDAPPDPRMAEAIEIIRSARQPDGTWLQGTPHPGRVWFEVDVPVVEPSKWLTLSETRVLNWWDSR